MVFPLRFVVTLRCSNDKRSRGNLVPEPIADLCRRPDCPRPQAGAAAARSILAIFTRSGGRGRVRWLPPPANGGRGGPGAGGPPGGGGGDRRAAAGGDGGGREG